MNINSQFNQLVQQPKQYVNYNNFDGMDNNQFIFKTTYEELRKKMDKIRGIENEEQAGDFIYELAEALYKEEAGKITGMILELGFSKIMNMIINEPMDLKEQIDNGHKLIQKTNK